LAAFSVLPMKPTADVCAAGCDDMDAKVGASAEVIQKRTSAPLSRRLADSIGEDFDEQLRRVLAIPPVQLRWLRQWRSDVCFLCKAGRIFNLGDVAKRALGRNQCGLTR
jgi:hypothetical protein